MTETRHTHRTKQITQPEIMKLGRREQQFYLWYFIVHIPITVFIDSSVVIPPKWQLGAAQRVVNDHIAKQHDFLLSEKPEWLYWFVLLELVMQLPLFGYFVGKLWNLNQLQVNTDTKLKTWLRIYGWNASLTTLVCIIVIFQRGYIPYDVLRTSLTMTQKCQLASVYLPTFLIPLRLCLV